MSRDHPPRIAAQQAVAKPRVILSRFPLNFCQRCIIHTLITIVTVTVLEGGTRPLSLIKSNRFQQSI